MFKKLDFILQKYEELSLTVSDPAVIADQSRWQKLMKEMRDIEPIVLKYREYKKAAEDLESTKELLSENLDDEMREIAKMELSDLEEKITVLEGELKILLLPKDPNDEKNVYLELRAGTGGEEAALFAADLLRMYTRYAERRGWKTELTDINDTGIGGVKEAVVRIIGRGAFSRLKYESGVHRVQRVPETESAGRIHTSAATVAIMPEVEDVSVDLKWEDIRVDTFRASGHGGQYINMTDSAVRLTHIPTGVVVQCQDEKSQLKNKEKAYNELKSRLYAFYQQQQHDEQAAERKGQIGSGDRSERIRTYNFPQGRVTDHRIGLTLYKLDQFMDGDLDEIIDALITSEQAEKMKGI
ncbi:MAG: peptide chain release factor 1 [Firmicutes bacterium]|nr:peptide chain release factor 1 [Bacillota bacterium]MBQ2058846.1 peptide chain release factor 1 [Bacillota bacterium]MBQ4371132.1 peptide chain release factor 1 [Bacillota bacterium]